MTLALGDSPAVASPLRHVDARCLLIGLTGAVVVASALTTVASVALGFAWAVAWAAVARLPPAWVATRLSAMAPFVLLVALPLPLLEGWRGAMVAAVVVMKAATVGTLALIGVAAVTPSKAMAAARALGVPAAVVSLIYLSYRYTFVLADELARTRRALRARGFRAGVNAATYRTAGRVVAALVIRGGDRGERVAAALQSRGFRGVIGPAVAFRATAVDAALAGLMVAGFAALACGGP